MLRLFKSTTVFDKQWTELGLDDDDQYKLELEIMNDPSLGKTIRGTGGLRKIRFALEGKGKSGGIRVLYIDIIVMETVYFISAYAKSQQESLTDEEKKSLKAVVEQIKKEGGKHR